MSISNVIIAAVPRSGSSLVASIFAAHGLWVGEHSLKQVSKTPVPYPSYENDEITKQLIKGENISHLFPKKPWLYKAHPKHCIVVKRTFPDACMVRVRRKLSSIYASSAESKAGQRKQAYEALCAMSGPWIDVDEIMANEYRTLITAFEYCGIAFDLPLAIACIDRSLWHHA